MAQKTNEGIRGSSNFQMTVNMPASKAPCQEGAGIRRVPVISVIAVIAVSFANSRTPPGFGASFGMPVYDFYRFPPTVRPEIRVRSPKSGPFSPSLASFGKRRCVW